MTRIVKNESVRCIDCLAEAVRPRSLARVDIADDSSCWVVILGRKRHRYLYEDEQSFRTMNEEDPLPPLTGVGDRTEAVLPPGASVTVECGRQHRGQTGKVVVDDAVIASTIRRAGYDPEGLRRLSSSPNHRSGDPPPPPLPG